MDFFTVIQERRSIRKYTDQALEQEKIDAVLEAARLAPSWSNKQCWRFLVLTEQERRSSLFEAFSDLNPAKSALAQAPVILVVLADPDESGVANGMEYYIADAAIACEHLCLAVYALGLGTCWMGWYDEAFLKRALGVPEHLKIVGLTSLGYPAKHPDPRPRKSLAEIVFYNRWPLQEKKA